MEKGSMEEEVEVKVKDPSNRRQNNSIDNWLGRSLIAVQQLELHQIELSHLVDAKRLVEHFCGRSLALER